MAKQNGSNGTTDGGVTGAGMAPGDIDPGSAAMVDGRLALIEARFGERFDDAQRERIRLAIERQLTLADRLRRTPLSNADEPEIVFRPHRGSERGRGEEQGG